MTSSIFGRSNGNSILSIVNSMRTMGNPQMVYRQMYQTDPRFRQFADSMKGKSPEQAFRENGLDFDQIRGLIR